MQWDPFLMKILLKKEICGSHEQCTGPAGTQLMLFFKKIKKKSETQSWTPNSVSKRILKVDHSGVPNKQTVIMGFFSKITLKLK